jgi:hypothetical protein
MWLVLLGCHGAGKTSLGKALARRMGWAFHEEIGRLLAEDPRWRAKDLTAASSQQAFDDELFRREALRDREWPASRPRIIETWHPGNLAYARARGSLVAPSQLASIQLQCRSACVRVLPVIAPRGVLAARQSEPGELEFFLSVAGCSLLQAERLGLAVLPPVWTHPDPPDHLASRLAPWLLELDREGRALSSPEGAPR